MKTMKKMNLRLTVLMAVMIMMTMTAMAKKQDIGGRVIDESGEPLPYVAPMGHNTPCALHSNLQR